MIIDKLQKDFIILWNSYNTVMIEALWPSLQLWFSKLPDTLQQLSNLYFYTLSANTALGKWNLATTILKMTLNKRFRRESTMKSYEWVALKY